MTASLRTNKRKDFGFMNKKRTLWIIILSLSLLIIAGCSVFLIYNNFIAAHNKEIISSAESDSPSNNTESSSKPEVPVDFDKLKKINPDIYAWINIPETEIDYPILQSSTDNSYYLSHTVDGKKAASGSIYTENYNKKDFSDFNTVIYGHNMKNGTMFGSLKQYRNTEFLKQNQYINIYLPGRILKYKIFAEYVWDDRHILLNIDFRDLSMREAYIEMIESMRSMNAYVDSETSVTADDKIITLSTCTGNDNQRFLVQGVLIYDSDAQ